MMKHLTTILLLTFVTGFATGIFLYFTTGERGGGGGIANEVPLPEPETGFEVIAYTYGGCERVGCTSYRMDDTGAYTYITRSRTRGDERYEDVISERQLEELTALIEETDLARIDESTYDGTCPVTYDGIAYRYEVRRGSVRYSLDSCVESLDGEELFLVLTQYFAIMDAIHRIPE